MMSRSARRKAEDNMKSTTSTPQSPVVATGRIDRRQKQGRQTLANTSVITTKGPKAENAKSSVVPTHSPEDLLTKNLGQISLNDKKINLRTSLLAKETLTKKAAEAKPPQTNLKCKVLADISDLILKNCCKNIIVMAGAGISTPSGIPDFRTPGTGLYDNLQQYNIPYAEAIFDIDYFAYNPKPFFALAKELYPGRYEPNYIHYFVRLLHEKGLLLRCYTQNIDGLERMAGIPPEKLVEAHGTFSTASCHLCYSPFPSKEARDCITNGRIPRCNICSGVVKPDIVFFGEDLPKNFNGFSKDFPKADLLIIMGTALEIDPFASIVNSARPNIPRLLLNRDLVGPFKKKPLKSTDVVELGELCDITKKFVHALNWQDDMEEMIEIHRIQCRDPARPSKSCEKPLVISPPTVVSKVNRIGRVVRSTAQTTI
ncbi:NAD-dependent protein deacetylase sirtuin-3-like isoform X2 [Ascaphus truei]|uniref:NAD-dependent protein deacetylase sirtuin-3-like isoform X2 n=1 Tax=Ascaphus truei TaxID=8439 RepID=UPI003F59870D